jgi:hypothetical protein
MSKSRERAIIAVELGWRSVAALARSSRSGTAQARRPRAGQQREAPGLRAGGPHEVRPARLTSWRVMSARGWGIQGLRRGLDGDCWPLRAETAPCAPWRGSSRSRAARFSGGITKMPARCGHLGRYNETAEVLGAGAALRKAVGA